MAATRFEFDDLSEPGFCFLSVQGALTRDTWDDFALHAGLMLASEQSKLMVDLRRVPLLRSSYLAALVELHERAAERRKLLSIVATPQQADRLRRIGVDRVLRIVAGRQLIDGEWPLPTPTGPTA